MAAEALASAALPAEEAAEEEAEELSEALAEEQNEEAIDFFADPGTSDIGPRLGRRQAESMVAAQEALVKDAAVAGRGEEAPLPWLQDTLPATQLPPEDNRITAKRLMPCQRRRQATVTRRQVCFAWFRVGCGHGGGAWDDVGWRWLLGFGVC